jgi:dolichyl-phosphate beta-glucosyltransferase
MAWQQAAGMSFAMPGGYFIGPGPGSRAAVHGEASRTGLLFRDVLADGVLRPVTPQLRQDFDADLGRWKACAAVLGPTPNAETLRAQATALIGREPEPVEGVLLWRDLNPPG